MWKNKQKKNKNLQRLEKTKFVFPAQLLYFHISYFQLSKALRRGYFFVYINFINRWYFTTFSWVTTKYLLKNFLKILNMQQCWSPCEIKLKLPYRYYGYCFCVLASFPFVHFSKCSIYRSLGSINFCFGLLESATNGLLRAFNHVVHDLRNTS